MAIIRGCLEKEEKNGLIYYTGYLSVDDICKDDTPHVNFITWCKRKNLLVWDEYDELWKVHHMLGIEVEWSKDRNKNETVREMFRKYDVFWN